MKKFGIVVIALLLIAVGGYVGVWYAQAKVAKSQVMAGLDAVNGLHPLISYESITTTGFPLSVGVSINQPVVEVPVSKFLKPFAHALPIAPDGSEVANIRRSFLNIPAWQEKIVLDGRIVVTVDALSNSYHIRPEGSYAGNTAIGDEDWKYAINSGDEARGCHIAFNQGIASESFLQLWNWQLLSEDPEVLLRNIKKVDCDIPSIEYFSNLLDKQSYNSEPSHIFFENNSTADVLDFKFDLNLPGMQANEAYDELAERYFQLIYNRPLPDHYRLSLYGKQSMRLKGEVSINEKQPEKHPMRIVLDQFVFNSEVANTEYSLRLITNPTGDTSGTGELVNRLTASANEKGYDLYLSRIEEAIGGLHDQLALLGDAPDVNKDELTAMIKNVVPRAHELGEMIFSIDANLDAKEAGSVALNIGDIELGATPYGLKGNGGFEVASIALPIPTGQVDLECRSCEHFVTDIVKWSAKLKPLMRVSGNESEYAAFLNMDEQELGARLVRFLKSIDSSGNADLKFAIKLDESGVFTVNKLSTNELVLGLINELGPLINPNNGAGQAAPALELQ